MDMVKFHTCLYQKRVSGPETVRADFLISKEGIMLEVTQPAVQQIAEYFKGKDVKPIRIFLNEGG